MYFVENNATSDMPEILATRHNLNRQEIYESILHVVVGGCLAHLRILNEEERK